MAFIKRLRNQNWLFHPTIADLIEEDHICRLVDDVVENIDFKSIAEKYDGPGSPAYHPKVMMKLLIQGTIDGIRSYRKVYRVTAKTVLFQKSIYYPIYPQILHLKLNNFNRYDERESRKRLQA